MSGVCTFNRWNDLRNRASRCRFLVIDTENQERSDLETGEFLEVLGRPESRRPGSEFDVYIEDIKRHAPFYAPLLYILIKKWRKP